MPKQLWKKGKKMSLNLWGSNTKATKRAMSSTSSSNQRARIQVFLFTKAESHFVSGVLVDQHTALEEVFIFFDTATYDQIERDVKVDTIPWLKLKSLEKTSMALHFKSMTKSTKSNVLYKCTYTCVSVCTFLCKKLLFEISPPPSR